MNPEKINESVREIEQEQREAFQKGMRLEKTPPHFFLPIEKVEVFLPEHTDKWKAHVKLTFVDDTVYQCKLARVSKANIPHTLEENDVFLGFYTSRTAEMESFGFSWDMYKREMSVERDTKQSRTFRPLNPFKVRVNDLENMLHIRHTHRHIRLPMEQFRTVEQKIKPFKELANNGHFEDIGNLTDISHSHAASLFWRLGIDIKQFTFCRATLNRSKHVYRKYVKDAVMLERKAQEEFETAEKLSKEEQLAVAKNNALSFLARSNNGSKKV